MAGVQWSVPSGEVSLSAGVAKTVLQVVAASNHRVLIKMLKVFGKGTVSSDTPILVELVRQSTAGTSTAGTPVKVNEGDNETLTVTARVNATVEPTTSDVIEQWYIHPQGGSLEYTPITMEHPVIGGGRLGVRMTAAQAQTVLVTARGDE